LLNHNLILCYCDVMLWNKARSVIRQGHIEMARADFCDCVNCGEEFLGLGGMLRCSGCQATRAASVTVTRDRLANSGMLLARPCSAGIGGTTN
jgi:hypothetical protein